MNKNAYIEQKFQTKREFERLAKGTARRHNLTLLEAISLICKVYGERLNPEDANATYRHLMEETKTLISTKLRKDIADQESLVNNVK